MKRPSCIAATLLLAAMILSACGGTPPPTATSIPAPTSNTAASTSTELPTAAAGQLPTNTPAAASEATTAPSAADYTEIATTSYMTEYSLTNVVGVFRYNGKQTIVTPDVKVTARDATGKDVSTDPFILKTVVLKPGSLLLYKASFYDPLPEGTIISATVSGGSTDKDLLDALSGDFETTNIQFVQSDIHPVSKKATGTLKNVGTTTTNNIQILVAFYGPNDQLLDVATGTTTKETLAPGEESDFTVDGPNAADVIRADIVTSASVNR